eukprot:gnl/Dysnectes_brevis/2416_a2866_1158.p1 GENE.gnl/Dysnectes_brevis/2416_a2866_1158~~gnl/Dysnectes_brevis/2416_a2866_1158.p1  ORF type:complete len:218 (+),score=30.12 gnl/Dysnectes_brevis/2416_a2866_1158:19-672(+)
MGNQKIKSVDPFCPRSRKRKVGGFGAEYAPPPKEEDEGKASWGLNRMLKRQSLVGIPKRSKAEIAKDRALKARKRKERELNTTKRKLEKEEAREAAATAAAAAAALAPPSKDGVQDSGVSKGTKGRKMKKPKPPAFDADGNPLDPRRRQPGETAAAHRKRRMHESKEAAAGKPVIGRTKRRAREFYKKKTLKERERSRLKNAEAESDAYLKRVLGDA